MGQEAEGEDYDEGYADADLLLLLYSSKSGARFSRRMMSALCDLAATRVRETTEGRTYVETDARYVDGFNARVRDFDKEREDQKAGFLAVLNNAMRPDDKPVDP